MKRSLHVISLSLFVVACTKHDDAPRPPDPKPAPAVKTTDPATKPAVAEVAPTPANVDASAAKAGPAYLGVEGTGLVRVDGGKAKTVIAHRYPMRDIAVGPNNIVYAIAIGGAWSIDGDKVTELPKVGSYTSLDKIAVGPDGVLWGLDPNGVSRWDGKAWTVEPAKTFEASLLHDIAVDRAGRVWIATPDHLWRLDGDHWTRLDGAFAGTNKPYFETVVAGPAGEVYTTGLPGVFVFANDNWKKLAIEGRYGGGMRDLAIGADGRISASGGVDDVALAPPGGASHLVDLKALGVSAHRAEVMAVDGQGRTWLRTDNGVAILGADGKLAQQWAPGTVAGINGKIEAIGVVGGGPTLPELTAAARGSVTGKIVSAGKPVAGADVEICESPLTMFQKSPCDSATVSRRATTGADGTFTLTDVSVGSYGFAVKPRSKWLVFFGSSTCCTTLENGQTYDVGSITLDKLE
jgi:hypothetical protein